jgi:hypothetical protein
MSSALSEICPTVRPDPEQPQSADRHTYGMSDETENRGQPERLSISMIQIIASVLAAVSASVAASYFGVAGTVIGAALGSVVSVVGGAIYAHSITRTRDRLRRTAVEDAVRQRFDVADPQTAARARWLAPKQLALVASALFVIAIGTVTGLELLTGKPVSSTVGGGSQSGTSLFGATDRHSQQPTTPSSTPVESTPASRPTTTVTVTQTPSDTPTTPSPSSTPSATVTPTGSTSPTPSATTTPSTSPSP